MALLRIADNRDGASKQHVCLCKRFLHAEETLFQHAQKVCAHRPEIWRYIEQQLASKNPQLDAVGLAGRFALVMHALNAPLDLYPQDSPAVVPYFRVSSNRRLLPDFYLDVFCLQEHIEQDGCGQMTVCTVDPRCRTKVLRLCHPYTWHMPQNAWFLGWYCLFPGTHRYYAGYTAVITQNAYRRVLAVYSATAKSYRACPFALCKAVCAE